MLLNYISFPVFIVSFAIGLFFIYILGPNLKKIIIYPSPENVDKILFKDKADQCFSLKPEEVVSQLENGSNRFRWLTKGPSEMISRLCSLVGRLEFQSYESSSLAYGRYAQF